MKRIVTTLWFDDQAEEAAKFYISLVGGKITNTMYLTETVAHATHKEPGSVLTVDFKNRGPCTPRRLGHGRGITFISQLATTTKPPIFKGL